MAFPSPSKFESTNEPKGKAIVQAFQLLSYAIKDEAISRQAIYMSCLETCGEAAGYIAQLTRQKKQAEAKNRFLQKEMDKQNVRFRALQSRLEEPKESSASPDDIPDEEMLAIALPLLVEDEEEAKEAT